MSHLSPEELLVRTERRKIAGANQTYPEHELAPATHPIDRPPVRSRPVPLSVLPCRHLGDRVPGQPCGSQVMWCRLHNVTTMRFQKCDRAARHCETCPDRAPVDPVTAGETVVATETVLAPPPAPALPAPPPLPDLGSVGRRHLAYFVLPVSGNGVWQRGIDQLRLRWPLFTGKKVVIVARGESVNEQGQADEQVKTPIRRRRVDPPEVVRRYLPADAEVVEVENDTRLWEQAGWPEMWRRVLSDAHESDAVLYAHAKGVTRRLGSPCHAWTDLLYRLNLDYWHLVEARLRQHPLVGSLFRGQRVFTWGHGEHAEFHYSGNFWWARVAGLAERLANVPVQPYSWGPEAWVGAAFRHTEAASVFTPPADFYLYKPADMERVLADFATWSVSHAPQAAAHVPQERPPSGTRLSIIVPTRGRPSIDRTLRSITSQLLPGDELIVQRDSTGDWGATPRTRGQRMATGDYLLFMDDDDIYLSDALAAVRRAIRQHPGRPHLFRMSRPMHGDHVPRDRVLQLGNVSTQCIVLPNDPSRLGVWGTRYEGDFDFIASSIALYPPDAVVWHDEVISVWRPQ